jgi:hypothetical protein
MSVLKLAEVGDLGGAAVAVDAQDAVMSARYRVRASSTGKNCVECVADERDFGMALYSAAPLSNPSAARSKEPASRLAKASQRTA